MLRRRFGGYDVSSYITDPRILNGLGTFDASWVATSLDSAGVDIGDAWPFEDTVVNEFRGAPRDRSVSPIPQLLYEDFRLLIVAGSDVVGFDGLPMSRCEFATWIHLRRALGHESVRPHEMVSPVLRLDRSRINGIPYSESHCRDTLASFPINLYGTIETPRLSFDYMRSGRQELSASAGGCEYHASARSTQFLDRTGKVVREGDSLICGVQEASGARLQPIARERGVQVAAIDAGHDFEFQNFNLSFELALDQLIIWPRTSDIGFD